MPVKNLPFGTRFIVTGEPHKGEWVYIRLSTNGPVVRSVSRPHMTMAVDPELLVEVRL